MINQKGGLAQSAEEIKTKAKQDMAASADYNKMIFQLQAFVALIEILFGDESIVASKLRKFICLIEVDSIFYKGCAALDDFFPSKVLWSVCTRLQLFFDNCNHVEKRENVDNSFIDFSVDHRDIILDQFGGTLPPCFKKVTNKEVTNKDSDNEIKKGKNQEANEGGNEKKEKRGAQ